MYSFSWSPFALLWSGSTQQLHCGIPAQRSFGEARQHSPCCEGVVACLLLRHKAQGGLASDAALSPSLSCYAAATSVTSRAQWCAACRPASSASAPSSCQRRGRSSTTSRAWPNTSSDITTLSLRVRACRSQWPPKGSNPLQVAQQVKPHVAFVPCLASNKAQKLHICAALTEGFLLTLLLEPDTWRR